MMDKEITYPESPKLGLTYQERVTKFQAENPPATFREQAALQILSAIIIRHGNFGSDVSAKKATELADLLIKELKK